MNYLKIQNGRHLGHFLPHYFFDIRNNAVKALIFFIPEGGGVEVSYEVMICFIHATKLNFRARLVQN